MAFRVQVNVEAEEDLIEIWEDIATHNVAAADRNVRLLGEKIDTLADMPDRGKMRDDLGAGIRMLVEGKYLIFYRVGETQVEILRVIHGARDLSQILI